MSAASAVENLHAIRTAIADSARRAKRAEEAVTLVAVSKTFEADAIRPVLEAGQRVFGENRVQEAQGKWPALREAFPDLELHLIGPLQSNKAKEAVALFDVIESVDRPKIAEALAAEMQRQNRFLPCLVQVNTGKEAQKAGILPEEADAFIAQCRTLGLTITGLMCIPPVDEEPALHFALLREIGRRNGLAVLSMGMSADYQTAVALGATHVRVGSALFGSR
ncbi:YggS family pyridoxal phosphate-dependent enzyme [Novispirillum itersonii]|uniref:YggS family pyridoxal phosphate-dependent enzyme n=1 Tax=Novispirillum itersonii TaxID=189 RepID=UPI0003771292|nr:YggS family pyridoxal phosphate-dependent enzyme [Novispirillum itersonii]